jgi:hypothetical protein
MPSTTNYGWSTPADSDLVKDGAAAIRTLGSSIDTTVFNNASAGIPKTIVDAKGDLIAATASDTVSRLAVGTNGQVLTADSTAATGLAWGSPSAGGMTSLASGNLSGSSSISITSISGSYNELIVSVSGATDAAGGSNMHVRFNSDTGTNYQWSGVRTDSNVLLNESNDTRIRLSPGASTASTQSAWLNIPNYASTAKYKTATGPGNNQTSGAFIVGLWKSSSAITSIQISNADAANFLSGTYTLYGVK